MKILNREGDDNSYKLVLTGLIPQNTLCIFITNLNHILLRYSSKVIILKLFDLEKLSKQRTKDHPDWQKMHSHNYLDQNMNHKYARLTKICIKFLFFVLSLLTFFPFRFRLLLLLYTTSWPSSSNCASFCIHGDWRQLI